MHMKIRWFLPEKYNKKWLLIFLAFALVLFCLLAGIRLLSVNSRPDISWIPGLFLFSLLVSLLVCAFGFFDLRFVFSLTALGIVTGMILMVFTISGNRGGWEDLIGVLLFLEFSVCGLAAGILAELCVFFVRRLREKRRE